MSSEKRQRRSHYELKVEKKCQEVYSGVSCLTKLPELTDKQESRRWVELRKLT